MPALSAITYFQFPIQSALVPYIAR